MANYTKDIVVDYDSAPIGSTEEYVAFGDFNSFLQTLTAGDTVTLNVPLATYSFDDPSTSTDLFQGVLGGITLTVNCNGSTFTTQDGVLAGGFFLSNRVGIVEDNVHSSRIATVSAGATSVTLLTPSEHTRFAVSSWICVAGIDMQGFGAPPNPAFFEYRQVTSKSGGSNEIIHFSEPLEQEYLSTWPLYDGGGASNQDLGGPATIYSLPNHWDLTCTINDLNVTNNYPTYYKGNKLTLNNCVSVSSNIFIPSACREMILNDCIDDVNVTEIDKMVGYVEYNNCTLGQMQFQSSGTHLPTTFNNCDVTTFNGTPRNIVINGGSVGSLQIGATSYGWTESVEVNDCVVTSISVTASAHEEGSLEGLGYTIADGVIRWPFANKSIRWAVPGVYCYFDGFYGQQNGIIKVVSVTDDGTDTIVTVDDPDFQESPLFFIHGVGPDGHCTLYVHPCPIWRGTGNSGNATIVDLNNAGAQDKPIFSYSKRTYTHGDDLTDIYDVNVWGEFVSMTVNVTEAFSGAAVTAQVPYATALNAARDDLSTFGGVFDLKQTGSRTVTATTASTEVGSDNFDIPSESLWFIQAGINASRSVSGESAGIVEIEMVGDQGIDVAATTTPHVCRSIEIHGSTYRYA